MESQENRFESSRSGKYDRIPRAAKLIDTVISMVICGIGFYHLTQPNQACYMKRLKYLHIIHEVRHLVAPISRNVRLRFLLVSLSIRNSDCAFFVVE